MEEQVKPVKNQNFISRNQLNDMGPKQYFNTNQRQKDAKEKREELEKVNEKMMLIKSNRDQIRKKVKDQINYVLRKKKQKYLLMIRWCGIIKAQNTIKKSFKEL